VASAPGSIEPVQIRLDDVVGHINAITHKDAAKMGGQLRRLTLEEVFFGRLHILPIKDVAERGVWCTSAQERRHTGITMESVSSFT